MLRKIACILLGTAMFLGSVSALAATQTGSIGVMLDGEGVVTLYRVGSIQENRYRLLDSYGGTVLGFDDILSADLAAWLAQEVFGGQEKRSADGLVTFSGLEQGLYLLVQTDAAGGIPFTPFLVSLPWDGDQWCIQTSPKIEELLERIPHTGDQSALPRALALAVFSGAAILYLLSEKATGRKTFR